MKSGSKGRKHWLFHSCRLAAQIAALIVTVFGSFALIRMFGLPRWAFMGTVLLAGLFACGWICPYGTAQEWLRRLGKRLGLGLRIPEKIDRYLLFSRSREPLETHVFKCAIFKAPQFLKNRHPQGNLV